jgi:hypothetical protein
VIAGLNGFALPILVFRRDAVLYELFSRNRVLPFGQPIELLS